MQSSSKSYKINITNPKYCLVISDTLEGTTYGEVKDFGEAQQMQLTPSVASGQLYGNGAVVDASSKITGITAAFQSTKIPVEVQQDIFNYEVTDGVVQVKAGTNANYIAVGYEVEQTDGNSQYVWLLKGRPQPMNDSVQQSESGINYSTDTINIDFVQRVSDKFLKFFADSSNPEFSDSQAAAWFSAGPSAPVAPTSETPTGEE